MYIYECCIVYIVSHIHCTRSRLYWYIYMYLYNVHVKMIIILQL